MRICDRCGEKALALCLQDPKDAQTWDLCHNCRDAFFRFMKIPIEKPEKEALPTDKPETKKKAGRPRKNG